MIKYLKYHLKWDCEVCGGIHVFTGKMLEKKKPQVSQEKKII